MRTLVPLFFLLGTAWFAVQLFGYTGVLLMAVGLAALWLVVQIGGLAVLAYFRWEDFFKRLAVTVGYAFAYAVAGTIVSFYLTMFLGIAGWGPALWFLNSPAGDAIMYGWFGAIFAGSFVITWIRKDRKQAADFETGNQPTV